MVSVYCLVQTVFK